MLVLYMQFTVLFIANQLFPPLPLSSSLSTPTAVSCRGLLSSVVDVEFIFDGVN